MDVQEETTKFLKLCRKATDNDKEVLQLIKKRFNKADKTFLSSDEFLRELNETAEKIIEDYHNKYVHLRKLLALLKSHDSKKKKRHVSDSDSSLPDAKRKRKNESEEDEKTLEKESPGTSKSNTNVSIHSEERAKPQEKTDACITAENSSVEPLSPVHMKEISTAENSSTEPLSPIHLKESLTDEEDFSALAFTEEPANITIQSLPIKVDCLNVPPSLSPKVSLKRLSLRKGKCMINGAKASELLHSDNSGFPSAKLTPPTTESEANEEDDTSLEPKYVKINLEDDALPDIPPTPVKTQESQSDVEYIESASMEEEEEGEKEQRESEEEEEKEDVQRDNKKREESEGDEVEFVGIEVIQDLDEGEAEKKEANWDTPAAAKPAKEEADDDEPAPVKGSKRQLQKLITLLERISAEIQKLEERELSLDELDDDNSAYAMEDKYKKKFVKVWNKYCEVAGRPPSTGRPTERKFRFEGTRYPEINKKIEKFINVKKIFPDYHDIRDIIAKCNRKYQLRLRPTHVDNLARDAFTLVGNELQKRRLLDFSTDFESRLAAPVRPYSDPALFDRELRQKLDTNKKTYKDKMAEVINKYAHKQEVQGDETEDESESDEDDEKKGEESDTVEPNLKPTPPDSEDEHDELATRSSKPVYEDITEQTIAEPSFQTSFMSSLSLGQSTKDKSNDKANPIDCEDQNSPESITYEVLVDSAQLRKDHQNAGDDIAEVMDLTDSADPTEENTNLDKDVAEKTDTVKNKETKKTPERNSQVKNIGKSPHRKIIPERLFTKSTSPGKASSPAKAKMSPKHTQLVEQLGSSSDSDSQSILPPQKSSSSGVSEQKLEVLSIDDDVEMETETEPVDHDTVVDKEQTAPLDSAKVEEKKSASGDSEAVKPSASDDKEAVSFDVVGYVSLINIESINIDSPITDDPPSQSSIAVLSSDEQEELETIDLTSSQPDQTDTEAETCGVATEKSLVNTVVPSTSNQRTHEKTLNTDVVKLTSNTSTHETYQESSAKKQKREGLPEVKRSSPSKSETVMVAGGASKELAASTMNKSDHTQALIEMAKVNMETVAAVAKKILSPRSKGINLEKVVTSLKPSSTSASAKGADTTMDPKSQATKEKSKENDISYIEIDDDSLCGSPTVKPLAPSTQRREEPESIDLTSPKAEKKKITFSDKSAVEIVQKVMAESSNAGPLLKSTMEDLIKNVTSTVAANALTECAITATNGQHVGLQNQMRPKPIVPHQKVIRRKLDMNVNTGNSSKPIPSRAVANKSFAASFRPLDNSVVGNRPVSNSSRPFVSANRSAPSSSLGTISMVSSTTAKNTVQNLSRLGSSEVANRKMPPSLHSTGSATSDDGRRRGKLSLNRTAANPPANSTQPRLMMPAGGRPSEVHFQQDLRRNVNSEPVCSTPVVNSRGSALKMSSRGGGLKISSVLSLATGQTLPVGSPPGTKFKNMARPTFPGQSNSRPTSSRPVNMRTVPVKPLPPKLGHPRSLSTKTLNSRPVVSRPVVSRPTDSRPGAPRPWSPRSVSGRPGTSRSPVKRLSLSSRPGAPRPLPSRTNKPVVRNHNLQSKEIVILSDSD